MTPQEINHAMLELNGWVSYPSSGCYRHPDDEFCKKHPTGGVGSGLLPRYTEDLNAVALVIEKLSDGDRTMYLINLNKITGHIVKSIDAKALQRCEAILRAVGKWVDE